MIRTQYERNGPDMKELMNRTSPLDWARVRLRVELEGNDCMGLSTCLESPNRGSLQQRVKNTISNA